MSFRIEYVTLLAKPSRRDRVYDIRFVSKPRAMPSAQICIPFGDIDWQPEAESVRYVRSGQRPDQQHKPSKRNPERVKYINYVPYT